MDTIRMLQQVEAAPDHIRVMVYDKGQEYKVGTADMPPLLAELFVERGKAEEVKPKTAAAHETSAEEVVVTEVVEEEPVKHTPRRPGPKETK